MDNDKELIQWLLNESGYSIEYIAGEAFISTYALKKIKKSQVWMKFLTNDKVVRLIKVARDLNNGSVKIHPGEVE